MGWAGWIFQSPGYRSLHGYVKASMPDLLGGDDSTPQFKDFFREFLAMKDFQSKESKFHF